MKRNTYFRKTAGLIVIAVMLSVLSACGKNGSNETTVSEASYTTVSLQPDSQMSNIDSISASENVYYLLYNNGDESYIMSVSQNGEEISRIENEDGTITAICAGDDGSLYYAKNVDESTGDDETAQSCILYKLIADESVAFILRLDRLLPEKSGFLFIDQILADSEGRIYVHWGSGGGGGGGGGGGYSDYKQGIVVLDGEGQTLFSLDDDSDNTTRLAITDDTVYALMDNSRLKPIDPDNQSMGENLTLPDYYHGVYSGTDGELYLDDGTNLYRYVPGTEEIQTVLNWTACLLMGSPACIVSNQDGSFLISTWSDVLILSEEKENKAIKKIVINLATDQAYQIIEAVSEFNKSSDTYEIRVTEYSEDDITKLNTEITAGNVPDIFCFGFNEMGVSALASSSQIYATKGLFADLYTFIDSDEGLGRESFIPNILKAAESDGKLYELPSSFWIDVIVGSSDVVGEDIGWTFDEMLEAIEKYPKADSVFGPYMTQELLLRFALAFNADDYIDWSRGECYFNSEDFMNILKFVGSHNTDAMENETRNELELIADGVQLLIYGKMSMASYMQGYYQYFNTDNITFIGFPTSEGAGNAIAYDTSFAISSTSEFSDIAWGFIRNFYLDDYDSACIPVNIAAMERHFAAPEDYEEEWEYGGDGYLIHIGISTEEDIARFRELIYSLDRVSRYNNSLYEIVMEEASSYFSGDKTAEEVAEIIQNRAQTYVSEQS